MATTQSVVHNRTVISVRQDESRENKLCALNRTEWIGNLGAEGNQGSQFCQESNNVVRQGMDSSTSDELIQETRQTSDISPETGDKPKLWPVQVHGAFLNKGGSLEEGQTGILIRLPDKHVW